MALMRSINRLNARSVAALADPGLYADGQGLYLKIGKGRRWVFIFQWRGKRREMGLGSAGEVSLADARLAASEARSSVRRGVDPIEKRDEQAVSVATFGSVADAYVKAKESGWRNAKHRQQWTNSLATHATRLRDLPVAEVTTDDVLAVLKPIWTTMPETASRVRGRIENVLDAAKAQRLRTGENPAAWRGNLVHLLPKRGKLTRGHQRALGYDGAPVFWAALQQRSGVAAQALQFTILTATRTSEALGATWNEVDLDAAVWTVPAERTKTADQLRVPLSDAALEVLSAVRPLGDTFIFPSPRNLSLSTGAMSALLKRMKVDATVHGFRSTFRDWAGDRTAYSREVVEAALGHRVGSAVERAYRRGDALAKRASLMADWANYLKKA
jgi:integrase